ncbi:hypothetical protein LshimejAT787_0504480 [Lyophyllum shimeji]|uniref:Uncharacterized protein n=1 Tax=Lyophyllum shimeji TaxID=47721 RepID=A0A9P3PNA9_LYOSH|nr:hypothetical protein LshimejAT787_0504480 [Lyophyllum shimeji]
MFDLGLAASGDIISGVQLCSFLLFLFCFKKKLRLGILPFAVTPTTPHEISASTPSRSCPHFDIEIRHLVSSRPTHVASIVEIDSQALQNLRRLKKLVPIGHPLAMMHPIHTWILDGCTADLEIFQNSVFPPSAIVSFLSRQTNLRHWKQNGVFQGGAIADTALPHLAVLDVHASTLAAFRTPRPLVRIRVKIDDDARDGACERGAIEALSRFGSTLSALHMEYSSTEPPNLTLAEVLGLLAKATPNLKLLVYTTKLACSIRDPSSKDCSEPLSRFPKLKVVVIQLQPHSSTAQDGNVMGERALDQCPWHMEGHVTDEDAGASVSSIGGELTSVFGTSDDETQGQHNKFTSLQSV